MSSESSASKLAIGGVQMCFESILPKSVYENTDATGETICGTLEREQDDVTPGVEKHRHHIKMFPTPIQLDTLFPLAGLAESPTDTFTVSDTVPSFAMQIERVAQAHLYAVSYIDVFILSGQRGRKPLSLEMQIISTTQANTTFSASPAILQAPYSFPSGSIATGGFTYLATARLFDRFALILNRKMASRFNNNLTADFIVPTDNEFSFGISIPYTTAHKDILDAFISATRHAGAAGTLQLARGGLSTLFTLANLKWMANPPSVPGKPEDIRQDIFFKIYKDGSTPSVVVTHDATA